jgi:hypothetical protein
MPRLSNERQEEILHEIAKELTEAVRPGWSQAILTWSGVVSGGTAIALTVKDAEGAAGTTFFPRW